MIKLMHQKLFGDGTRLWRVVRILLFALIRIPVAQNRQKSERALEIKPPQIMQQTAKFGLMMAGVLALASTSSQAVPLSVNFTDYPGAPAPGNSIVDADTAAVNDWFNDNYGITFKDAYLYYDVRDTFDAIGVASDSGPTTACVLFADGTDFVTVDWVAVVGNPIYIDAYDINGNLLDSFFAPGAGTSEGTTTLNGADIRKLTFHDSGGFVALSSLRYDYDGTTDGNNDDIPKAPDAGSSLGLLALSLIGLGSLRKRA